jgi:hypothetical protein
MTVDECKTANDEDTELYYVDMSTETRILTVIVKSVISIYVKGNTDVNIIIEGKNDKGFIQKPLSPEQLHVNVESAKKYLEGYYDKQISDKEAEIEKIKSQKGSIGDIKVGVVGLNEITSKIEL